MDALLMARMKEVEEQSRRLKKKMYVEERLKAEIVEKVLQKSSQAVSLQGDGTTSRGNLWR